MLTPQQINQIAFSKARFGGYDMQSVDAFLDPLTEDYITLYNENNTLKTKMSVLVKRLESVRKSEFNSAAEIASTQKTCDRMLKETKEKCAQLLSAANAEAAKKVKNIDKQVAAENARVDAAREAANLKIAEIQEQMRTWIETLEQVKGGAITEAPAHTSAPELPKLTGKPSIDRPWLKYYPPGAEQMTVPPVTLNEYLKMMCRGEHLTVLHYYGNDISWKEFFFKVDQTAKAMRAAGLGEGDQIPVLLQSVPEFPVILLAAEKIGASLLCRDNTIPENAEAISKTNAKIMFANDFITRAEVDAYTKAGIRKIIVVNPWASAIKSEMPEHILSNLNGRYTEPKIVSDEIATWEDFISAGNIYIGKVDAVTDLDRPLFRTYTSGSTGPSKQVIHSAKTMLGCIHQLSAYGASDEFRPLTLLAILPPALIAISVSMILMPMASNKLLILDPFVDENDLDLEVMRYKPHIWFFIPMFMEIFMRSKRIPADYDLSHLLSAGAGSESFNNSQIKRAQKFLNDHNCNAVFSMGYGLSEAGSSLMLPCRDYPASNGSVGIPMPMNTISIFRGDRECTYNEKGEICVNTPGMMLGYDNEEATAKTLIRHQDGKVWLHTGDTGYMNEDGVLYALGRGLHKRYNPANPEKSQRLVEISMENKIADAEVPGLADHFFVIIPDKQHNGYYLPYLYVVLKNGYTIADVADNINAVLKDFEHPVEIIQIPERPFYHFKTNRLHLEAPYARY